MDAIFDVTSIDLKFYMGHMNSSYLEATIAQFIVIYSTCEYKVKGVVGRYRH